MQIKNAKCWAKGGWEPYVLALLGYFIALAIRYALQPILDDHLPMLFFGINCIFIAFLYGFWPSFSILCLSIPTAMFFFVKPYFSLFSELSDQDAFILIVYTSMVTVTAFLLEWVRREQYRAVLLARVSDSRYRLLVEADEDRRAAINNLADERFSA